MRCRHEVGFDWPSPDRLPVLILADGRALRQLRARYPEQIDAVLQCRLGIRVTKMRLHVLDARELGHVGRAGAAEHLVGHTVDARLPMGMGQPSAFLKR